ncbi:uncharacterized protein C8Q71DRAFT_235259 [Rhodofomes roseus]|uniref:Uncharacterized protein n=1 Tax=Rhodofomes roseus TaxID=34475 RepID=A0ABQ8KVK5_9APHY|nr:uncharacterized protein C8Q71DRAFT_235259 [Rhodofomes roseus]KAH9843107.1 hypothetical protein C8Q71DRAFT_235259 [Rhodofomes roseus]
MDRPPHDIRQPERLQPDAHSALDVTFFYDTTPTMSVQILFPNTASSADARLAISSIHFRGLQASILRLIHTELMDCPLLAHLMWSSSSGCTGGATRRMTLPLSSVCEHDTRMPASKTLIPPALTPASIISSHSDEHGAPTRAEIQIRPIPDVRHRHLRVSLASLPYAPRAAVPPQRLCTTHTSTPYSPQPMDAPLREIASPTRPASIGPAGLPILAFILNTRSPAAPR